MPRRALRVLLVLTVMAAMGMTLSATHARATDDDLGDPDPRLWVPVAKSASNRVQRVSVSSDWPDDPFMLVGLRNSAGDGSQSQSSGVAQAARSYDGGRTWEPLRQPLPPGDLVTVRTEDGRRVILAGTFAKSFRGAESSLYRSDDEGETWSQPHVTPGVAARGWVVVSPTVRDDRYLLLVSHGRAYMSADLGLTWSPISVAPGQNIEMGAFSSRFVHDGTVFLAVVTISRRSPRSIAFHSRRRTPRALAW